MAPPHPVQIEAIVTSGDHNYVGHHGKPAGTSPTVRHDEVRLIAGRGIENDRYSAREEGHPRQITFFDMQVIDRMADELEVEIAPDAVRRNIFVRGIDLNSLVGRTFTLQGVRFEGVDPCKPCYWMDQAVAPGAESFMKGHGGLRAKILTDGSLKLGTAPFEVGEAS